MNVGLGTVATKFLSWDICFKFSVLGLCNVQVLLSEKKDQEGGKKGAVGVGVSCNQPRRQKNDASLFQLISCTIFLKGFADVLRLEIHLCFNPE
jgi:hypothetical protein